MDLSDLLSTAILLIGERLKHIAIMALLIAAFITAYFYSEIVNWLGLVS